MRSGTCVMTVSGQRKILLAARPVPWMIPLDLSTPLCPPKGTIRGSTPLCTTTWSAVDRGEALDTEKFVGEHPEIAGELRSLIDAEIQLRKFANAGGQANPPDDSTRSFAPARAGDDCSAGRLESRRRSGTKPPSQRAIRPLPDRPRLGKGAMGTVYLAEDTQLERQVALKTPHFEKDPTGELLERFYREARAAATLRHPNICPVYDVGTDRRDALHLDGLHRGASALGLHPFRASRSRSGRS